MSKLAERLGFKTVGHCGLFSCLVAPWLIERSSPNQLYFKRPIALQLSDKPGLLINNFG